MKSIWVVSLLGAALLIGIYVWKRKAAIPVVPASAASVGGSDTDKLAQTIANTPNSTNPVYGAAGLSPSTLTAAAIQPGTNQAATVAYQQNIATMSTNEAAKAAGVTLNASSGQNLVVTNTSGGLASVTQVTMSAIEATNYNAALARGYSPYQAYSIAKGTTQTIWS